MVYSLENIRYLKAELTRYAEKLEELRQNMADLKRRAGLDPDVSFPSADAAPQAYKAPSPSADSGSLFSGRFNF